MREDMNDGPEHLSRPAPEPTRREAPAVELDDEAVTRMGASSPESADRGDDALAVDGAVKSADDTGTEIVGDDEPTTEILMLDDDADDADADTLDLAPTPTLPKAGETFAERFEIIRASGSTGAISLFLARDQAPWQGCWSCGRAWEPGDGWCACGYGLDPVDVQLWITATPGPVWTTLADPVVAALAPVVQGPFADGEFGGWATRAPVVGQPSPPLPERDVAAWLRRAVAAIQALERQGAPIGRFGVADLTESRGPLRLNHLTPLVVAPGDDGMTSAGLATLALELATGSPEPSALAEGSGAGLSARFRRVLARALAGAVDFDELDAELAPAPASFTAGTASHIGPSHVRNDDSALVSMTVVSGEAGVEPSGVFVVADGISQGGRGVEASRLAVAAFRALAGTLDAAVGAPAADEDVTATLQRLANEASVSAHERLGEVFGVGPFRSGTTLVAVVLAGKDGIVAHLGDSRAYLLRQDTFRRLTDDHSPVFQAMLRGTLTPEAAAEHPARSAVSRYVGNDAPRGPDVSPLSIVPGDRLLLCSDGIWSVLDDDALATTIATHEPTVAARRLVEMALAAGTHDDSTAVVVRADEPIADDSRSVQSCEKTPATPVHPSDGEAT